MARGRHQPGDGEVLLAEAHLDLMGEGDACPFVLAGRSSLQEEPAQVGLDDYLWAAPRTP